MAKKIRPLWFTGKRGNLIIATDDGDIVVGKRDQGKLLSLLFMLDHKSFKIFAEMLKAKEK